MIQKLKKKKKVGTFSRKILPHSVDILKCRSSFIYTFYPFIHSTLLISNFGSLQLTGGKCILIIERCTTLNFLCKPTFLFKSREKSIQNTSLLVEYIKKDHFSESKWTKIVRNEDQKFLIPLSIEHIVSYC